MRGGETAVKTVKTVKNGQKRQKRCPSLPYPPRLPRGDKLLLAVELADENPVLEVLRLHDALAG